MKHRTLRGSYIFYACIISAFAGGLLAKSCLESKKAELRDLNGDGIADLIIENELGHRSALYGIRDGDSFRYLQSWELEKIKRSGFDYRNVERELNRKN
jgi:hypothetical protein